MGLSLCKIPFIYLIKCINYIYNFNKYLISSHNTRNITQYTTRFKLYSNYFNNFICKPFFRFISPKPLDKELSIEELCFIHDMKEEELNYELAFGSI